MYTSLFLIWICFGKYLICTDDNDVLYCDFKALHQCQCIKVLRYQSDRNFFSFKNLGSHRKVLQVKRSSATCCNLKGGLTLRISTDEFLSLPLHCSSPDPHRRFQERKEPADVSQPQRNPDIGTRERRGRGCGRWSAYSDNWQSGNRFTNLLWL